MSPAEYLRFLRMPHESRWQPMLMGLACCAAAAGGAVLAQASVLISAALTMLCLAAWIVGACAMIGYVRWFFRTELQQALQDKARAEVESRKSKGKSDV